MKRILSFAAVLCAAILSVSCANGIPDTKKGIMDAFVAGTLKDGIDLFGRPVLGGFDRKGALNTLSEDEVAAETHAILKSATAGRVMIGADCTVGSAPLANIQAAVAAAHGER
jgi:hypothetical protein